MQSSELTHEPGNLPCQVSKGLFVGSVDNARDVALLNELAIEYLVNAAQEFDHSWQGQDCYLHVQLFDRTSERITPFFDNVWTFIDNALAKETNVMIFCQHGISRSVTLALSYMMRSEQLSLGQAFAKLRAARPEAEPNPGFLRELRQLETWLYGQVTTTELLTRFDQGLGAGGAGAERPFLDCMADFVAGGDGRVGKEASANALQRVLVAIAELGPGDIERAVLPLLCESFCKLRRPVCP
jgi:protein-tyrosine phosphatase